MVKAMVAKTCPQPPVGATVTHRGCGIVYIFKGNSDT